MYVLLASTEISVFVLFLAWEPGTNAATVSVSPNGARTTKEDRGHSKGDQNGGLPFEYFANQFVSTDNTQNNKGVSCIMHGTTGPVGS